MKRKKSVAIRSSEELVKILNQGKMKLYVYPVFHENGPETADFAYLDGSNEWTRLDQITVYVTAVNKLLRDGVIERADGGRKGLFQYKLKEKQA